MRTVLMNSDRGTATTSLPHTKISQFWVGPIRNKILLRGFQALCRAMLLPPSAIQPHVEATVPGAMVPAAITLKRFFENATGKNLQHPLQKSGLLLTCYRLWDEHQEVHIDDEDIRQLIELAQEHMSLIRLSAHDERPTTEGKATRRPEGRDDSEERVVAIRPATKAEFQLESYEPGEIPRHVLQFIHDHIPTPRSFDRPEYPEFPPHAPRFPATPIVTIEVGGRPVVIKDESWNRTGTHKDRWAWEVVLRYKDIIAEVLKRDGPYQIPVPSMISSGSAALALQVALREKGLHNLRVVMDLRYRGTEVIGILEGYGAKIYFHDLEQRELSADDVLAITENPLGIELTTRNLEEPFERRYYDWLGYEVLNECPKHIFVPVGTGELFANIIFLINDEVTFRKNDPRLLHGEQSIKDVHVYGATTKDSKSTMTKLYASFRPMLSEVETVLEEFKANKTIGASSGIFFVANAQKALNIARVFGINTEHSGIAGLALFLEKIKEIPEDEKVLVINTGLLHIAT